MSIAVTINDKTSSGDVLLERIVNFPVERISVRDLIEARVCQEVEAYNMSASGEFSGLVQPTDSELMLNGFKLGPGNKIDIEKQSRAAISAFKSNRFFLFINDQQVTDLDDAILITPNTLVVFLKLVPLVGG